MDAQLLAMMSPVTIYVATAGSTADSTGKLTWGTPAARNAWQELETQIVTMRDGTRRETTHRLIVEAAIGDRDRIWLSGESSADATLADVPARVWDVRNEAGAVDHYEVLV